MYRSLLLVLMFFGLKELSGQQCSNYFTNVYDGEGADEPLDIFQTNSKEYVVAGRTTTKSASNYDGFLMKLDGNGKLLWSKNIGTPGFDEINEVIEIPGGGFVGSGLSTGFGNIKGQPFLFKTDAAGNIIWIKDFFRFEAERSRLTAFIRFKSGGYGLAFTIADSTEKSDGALARLDENGSIIWAKRFDNGGADGFYALTQNEDTLIAGGMSASGPVKQRFGVVVKLDISNGNVFNSLGLYRELNYYVGAHYNHKVIMVNHRDGILDMAISSETSIRFHSTTSGLLVSLLKINNAGKGIQDRLLQASPANGYTIESIKCAPSWDGGTYILVNDTTNRSDAVVMKWGPSGLEEFGRWLYMDFENSRVPAFCEVDSSSVVVAGYFEKVFQGNGRNIRVSKVDPLYVEADCEYRKKISFSDTGDYNYTAATWSLVASMNDWMGTPAVPVSANTLFNTVDECGKTLCFPKADFNSGCNATFSLVFEGESNFFAHDACPLSDGGYMVGGRIYTENYHYQETIVRLKPNGEREWVKIYNQYIYDGEITKLIPVAPNRVLAVVNTNVTINHGTSNHSVLMMLDNDGNVIWTKTFWYADIDIYDVADAGGGEFVAVFNGMVGSGYVNGYMGRFDVLGNLKWLNKLDNSLSRAIFSKIIVDGNDCYVGCQTYLAGDIFSIQRYNALTGSNTWHRQFKLEDVEFAQLQAMMVKGDSVYAVFNIFRQVAWNYTECHTLVVKGSKTGTGFSGYEINGVDYNFEGLVGGGEHTPRDITATKDGHFIVAQMAINGGEKVFSVTKFLPEGKPVWVKQFPAFGHFTGYSIQENHSNILITGKTFKGFGAIDLRAPTSFLLNLNADGEIAENATGGCKTINGIWKTKPLINLTEVASEFGSVEKDKEVQYLDRQVTIRTANVQSRLICSTPAVCNQVSLTGPDTLCAISGSIRLLINRNAGCTAPFSIDLDSAFFNLVKQGNDYVEMLPKKAGKSSVQVSLQSGCFNLSASKELLIILPSQIELGTDTTLCRGDSIRLIPGGKSLSYQWNTGSVDSFITISQTGKYKVTARDICGRVYTDSIFVSVRDKISMPMGADAIICKGDTVQLKIPAGFSGISVIPQATGVIQQGVIKLFPIITATYRLSGIHQTGCSGFDTLKVVVNEPSPFNIGRDTSFCKGSSILVKAPENLASYQWNTGATGYSISVKSKGIFAVTGIDANGCSFRDTLEVKTVFENPIVSLPASPVLCEGGTVTVTVPPGFARYKWNTGSTGEALGISLPGEYSVLVTDQNGCTGGDTLRINAVTPRPGDFLNSVDSICSYEKLTLQPIGNYREFRWNNGSASPQITVGDAGVYTLTVKDANGCTGTDSVRVVEKKCMMGFFMPNAFTPNGDGNNDVIKPLLFGNVTDYEFFIFGRFGEIIFQSKTPGTGWDGKLKGLPFPSGNFVWKCIYRFEGEEQKSEKGGFTLIR
jgi:gliding motility-associated-like protein